MKTKKKNKTDGNKSKNTSNGNGGIRVFVVSIFSDKAKGCRKGCIAAGMFMGEPLDAILS